MTSGLSRARLSRMHDTMAGYVERGEVPGVVTLLSRHGQVHVDAIGTKTLGGSDPMRHDTIFRITSMTKPITAVATMILVEECKLSAGRAGGSVAARAGEPQCPQSTRRATRSTTEPVSVAA